MPMDAADSSAIGAMWFTMAFLAAGLARSRGRSGLGWFLLTLIFGPFAAFFLAVVSARPVRSETLPADS